MENKKQDLYTVGIRENLICYFKNGKLHREAGPAVFPIVDKAKHFYLSDTTLYEEELKSSVKWAELMSIMLTHTPDNNTGYYLEGVQYDKNTWESLMEKKNYKKS